MNMLKIGVRRFSLTRSVEKQLPAVAGIRADVRYEHPRKYVIRRGKPYQHRPNYQRNEQEVLMDQILQPHFPTEYKFPDYSYQFKQSYQSRHMERNIELGPAKDTVELYGPDIVTYERCKADFEKSKNGFLGIVIMAGEEGDTMEDYVYFDNKLILQKAGANSFRYDDHIVWAYINRERPDLQFLKDVLSGCEEGDHEVLHFIYKEDTENLPKVLDAVKKHQFMEIFGGIIDGECYTPAQIRSWHKLNYESEMGQVLGILQAAPQQLSGLLDQVPRSTVNLLSQVQSETALILEQYLRDSEN